MLPKVSSLSYVTFFCGIVEIKRRDWCIWSCTSNWSMKEEEPVNGKERGKHSQLVALLVTIMIPNLHHL